MTQSAIPEFLRPIVYPENDGQPMARLVAPESRLDAFMNPLGDERGT